MEKEETFYTVMERLLEKEIAKQNAIDEKQRDAEKPRPSVPAKVQEAINHYLISEGTNISRGTA